MSYLEKRIFDELGVTEDQNKIRIHSEGLHGIPRNIDLPIFTSTQTDDIDILVYTLDRTLIEYDHQKADPEHASIYNNRQQYYHLTRLNPDRVTDGTKYLMPKGKGVYPFIPPALLEKYEAKTKIETLVLTEGYFKAFKASIHGMDIVGLSSITHYAASKTKQLHSAIVRIIETCKVKNVVMLYDGDCINISTKALAAGEDIAKRPQGFFSSMLKVRELLLDYDVEVWFAHINSDQIIEQSKGLDDLLCLRKGRETEIVADLTNLEKQGFYFYRMNVSFNIKKLQPYFNLKSPEQFYGYWSDIIKEAEFTYFGTKYRIDLKTGKLEKTMPKELRNFMRVGDDYYEMVEMPVLYGADNISIEGDTEVRMFRRKKETIKEDFGKEAIFKLPKYKAFINMPSHTNYQQVIKNCYNQYSQIKHEPIEGDWNTVDFFLKHIFAEQYELGLDYIQILYQYPTQILPILCLVSQERQTGKTTFIDFLKMIFGENCAKVGNAEITNQFNAFLTSRLIVGVDETNLEKNRDITERIKILSPTNRVFSQSKGVDHTEQWHFAKYILTSNFETNFIYTQEDEIRFWVRKIPHIQQIIPTLLNDLHEEIPAFLFFLNKRKISVPNTTRMWFEAKDLETEALLKLKEKQKPAVERDIVAYVKELFTDFPARHYLFTIEALQQRIPTLQKKDPQFLNAILKDNLHLVKYRKDDREITTRFKLPRYGTYAIDNEDTKLSIIWDSFQGRPYVFPADMFLTTTEMKELFQPEETPSEEQKLFY